MRARGHMHMRFDFPEPLDETRLSDADHRIRALVEDFHEFYDFEYTIKPWFLLTRLACHLVLVSIHFTYWTAYVMYSGDGDDDGDEEEAAQSDASDDETDWLQGLSDEDAYELVLPTGAAIGHRSLRRYWRQRVPLRTPEQRKRSQLHLQRLVASRALGDNICCEFNITSTVEPRFKRVIQICISLRRPHYT